jgi:hypothetical protein
VLLEILSGKSCFYCSARLLLAPSEVGGSRPTLSSGLYIVPGGSTGSSEERHYIIYWPEDSTWDDSAASSVSRNRVTFMRQAITAFPILLFHALKQISYQDM